MVQTKRYIYVVGLGKGKWGKKPVSLHHGETHAPPLKSASFKIVVKKTEEASNGLSTPANRRSA